VYTLDTNAIIYYLKGDAKVVETVKDVFDTNSPIYISTITEIELFGFRTTQVYLFDITRNPFWGFLFLVFDLVICQIMNIRVLHLKVEC